MTKTQLKAAMAKESESNREMAQRGQTVFTRYVEVAELNLTEAKQPYSITDAILSLMHYARIRGLNPLTIAESASAHYENDTIVCEKCGGMGAPDEHECKAASA